MWTRRNESDWGMAAGDGADINIPRATPRHKSSGVWLRHGFSWARPRHGSSGHRPGVIPAWGNAPENGFKTIFSANGAAYQNAADVPARGMMDRAVGPQESACIKKSTIISR